MDEAASITDIDSTPHSLDASYPALHINSNHSVPSHSNHFEHSSIFHPLSLSIIERHRSIFPRTDEKTLSSLYPSHLKLHFIQFFHRHGHRTPLVYRLPTLIPYSWKRCALAESLAYQHLYYHGNNGQMNGGGKPARGELIEISDDHASRESIESTRENLLEKYYLASKERENIFWMSGGNRIQSFQLVHETSLIPSYLVEETNGIDGAAMPKHHHGHCYYGQLTDTGRELMSQLGKYLREIYIQRLGFLPNICHPYQEDSLKTSIYLRSTNYTRTMESLQSVLYGLYPPSTLSNHSKDGVKNLTIGALPIHIRQEENETMYPWLRCIRYRELQSQFKKASHSLLAREIENVKHRLKHLFSIPDPFGIMPTYHGLFDNLYCCQEHGIDIDEGGLALKVKKKDMDSLELISVKEWFSGFQQSDVVVRLGIGRFLKEFIHSIEEKSKTITDPSIISSHHDKWKNLKMEIYSGHDTTIAPMLCTFKVFDESWPAFGSNITFELLEDTLQKSDEMTVLESGKISSKYEPALYVRMKSNDQVYQLPDCVGYTHPDDPSLCQLQQFLSMTRVYFPKNITKECELLDS